jgi:hypothetical protein
MKGIKQLSIGLACIASLAVMGCKGQSAVGYDAGLSSAAAPYEAGLTSAAGYDSGLKSANATALDMDSGMPPKTNLNAAVQAQTTVTTSAWEGGLTQRAVSAGVTGGR